MGEGLEQGMMSRSSSDHPQADKVPYRPRNVWKASVRREGDIVTKEYSGAPFVPRLFGRISLSWEEAALRRLEGMGGIPTFIHRLSPHGIQISAVMGRPLDKMKMGELSESCFKELVSLIHRIHDKGVAHGDLHQRNILVDEDRPSVIDFSTAYVKGRVPLFDGWIFRNMMLLDLERLYKVERSFFDRGDPPRMFFLYRMIKRFQ
jgi:RIO1 family